MRQNLDFYVLNAVKMEKITFKEFHKIILVFLAFMLLLYLVNDNPKIEYSDSVYKNSLEGCSNINSVLVNVSFIKGVNGYSDKCGFSVHCYSNCFNNSLENTCINNSQHCWSINSINRQETMDSCLKNNDIYYCACKIRNNCNGV